MKEHFYFGCFVSIFFVFGNVLYLSVVAHAHVTQQPAGNGGRTSSVLSQMMRLSVQIFAIFS